MSDDDYDVISNPGTVSLENSVDLDQTASIVRELPAFEDVQDRFETTRWAAEDIQAYVRKGLNLPAGSKYDTRRVKIYVDGAFDVFDVGSVPCGIYFHSGQLLNIDHADMRCNCARPSSHFRLCTSLSVCFQTTSCIRTTQRPLGRTSRDLSSLGTADG